MGGGAKAPYLTLDVDRKNNQIWCANGLRHVLCENSKINLKVGIILLASAFSFVWSRKAAKLAKMETTAMILNLEHNFTQTYDYDRIHQITLQNKMNLQNIQILQLFS